jgi:CCR4-NOT transcription complex subunit 3
VTQGVEIFESTFEKLGMSTNATQKDKLETDLKTQIKKLQRMRDTIKAWLGSSDIKDKSALTESRKLIEAVGPFYFAQRDCRLCLQRQLHMEQ